MHHLSLILTIFVASIHCYNQSCNTIGRIHEYSLFYLMVDDCGDNVELSDKVECEKESNVFTEKTLPVIDNNGVLYKNVFCARCNNASTYYYPNIDAHCYNFKKCRFNIPNKKCTCVPRQEECEDIFPFNDRTKNSFHRESRLCLRFA